MAGTIQTQSIYFCTGDGPDRAIVRGLTAAGVAVIETRSISDTLMALLQPGETRLLVADVRAGAIALLALLKEQNNGLPPTLLFDADGADIHTAIRALQLGVREYLLSTDSEAHRELSTRLMAERANRQVQASAPAPLPDAAALRIVMPPAMGVIPSTPTTGFRWDPSTHLIHIDRDYVRLSPIESRIFDLLLANRNRVVALNDLIEYALMRRNIDEKEGAKLLRPHLVRLRSKLESHPKLAHRIVNMRGNGYMMI